MLDTLGNAVRLARLAATTTRALSLQGDSVLQDKDASMHRSHIAARSRRAAQFCTLFAAGLATLAVSSAHAENPAISQASRDTCSAIR